METNNEVLWERLRDGDQKALEELYRLNYQVLFSYANKISRNRELSKDCVQEIFLDLWERRKKLGEVSRVRSYLLQSVWHSVIKKLKKNNVLISFQENDDYDIDIVFSYESVVIHNERKNKQKLMLKSAFHGLTKREREIIFMQYYEGLTIDEIRQITGLKYQSIKNLTYRALSSLKEKAKKNKII